MFARKCYSAAIVKLNFHWGKFKTAESFVLGSHKFQDLLSQNPSYFSFLENRHFVGIVCGKKKFTDILGLKLLLKIGSQVLLRGVATLKLDLAWSL